jgi:hypothetical protein
MSRNIVIKPVRPHVDDILERYRDMISIDFLGYKNHVYRTIAYAMHFLNQSVEHELLVETAFSYHDIGLWVGRELAYLEPSENVALRDNDKYQWGLEPDALRGAIHWHHKITEYKGHHGKVIEACRKADWIDASKGLIKMGLSKDMINEVEAAYPNFGFHQSLLRLAKDYGGSAIVGGIKVIKGIVKW